jgi:transcriptional regulator with XRE-family HTH domain
MPKIDDEAKRWQESTAARIGRAVKEQRKRLAMSVPQLAERTRELGYPIHRVAIGKIESGNRLGKLDTSELLILAKALEVPALWLLFPDMLDGEVEVTPGVSESSEQAALDFCGVDDNPLFELHQARADLALSESIGKPDLILNSERRIQSARRAAKRKGWVVND